RSQHEFALKIRGHRLQDEQHHVDRDQRVGDDGGGPLVPASECGARLAHRLRTFVHALIALVSDGRTAHAFRADGAVAPGAADVRHAVGMPVTGRRRLRGGRVAHNVPNNSIQLPSGSATNIQPMPGTGANSVTGSTTSYSESPN